MILFTFIRNYYNLDIKTLDQRSHKRIYGKEEERQILEVDSADTSKKN